MEYCQGLDLKKYINKYKKEKNNKRSRNFIENS